MSTVDGRLGRWIYSIDTVNRGRTAGRRDSAPPIDLTNVLWARDADRMAREQQPPKTKTIWLLGAGFSRFLGAPLFSECLTEFADTWVRGWLVANQCSEGAFGAAKDFYSAGEKKLWKNAEQCISDLHEAIRDGALRSRILTALSRQQQLLPICAQMTQYMCIATSAFMDHVETSTDVPERWLTYLSWMRSLGPNDAIVSFNYDRVVEVLQEREKKEIQLVKLHGTVPPKDQLIAMVKDGNQPVKSIKVPGPDKAADMKSQEWLEAADLLKRAAHLVVIGYSFPESDPAGRQFILSHCNDPQVTVVLGLERDGCLDGRRVAQMFKRMGAHDVADTQLYAQEYLSEGTARLDNKGRFLHRRTPT